MSASASISRCLVHKVLIFAASCLVARALVIGSHAQGPVLKSASAKTKKAIGMDVGQRCQCRNAPYKGGAIEDEEWHDGNIAKLLESTNPVSNATEPHIMVKLDGASKPIHCQQVRKLDYYIFEWVGFQETAVTEMPNSPHSPTAKCLTAGGRDRLGGKSLRWEKCQDETVIEKITSNETREAQMFKLNDDGSVASKTSGLCIRRLKCKEGQTLLSFVYDLGPCRDDMNLRISVKKPQANSMEHMREMGFLAHAVRREDCELCGAYQLKNMCLGEADCGTSWQAQPGWTKLASTYVGIDAVMGRSKYRNAAGGEAGEAQMHGLDFSGIGESKVKRGQCGTYATDRPLKESFFYLLKA